MCFPGGIVQPGLPVLQFPVVLFVTQRLRAIDMIQDSQLVGFEIITQRCHIGSIVFFGSDMTVC